MRWDFRGRVVLVTGASSGIGAATAEAFARAGASVVFTGRAVERMEGAVRNLGSTTARHAVHHLDVTDRAEVFAVVEKVAAELGRIDILVNNAGIGQCCPLEELSSEDMRRLIETNLTGLIHCTQAVVPRMRRQGGGQIVNVASTVAYKGIPYLSVYCATKFAVRGLSEALRLELARDRIEVILVSPGTTGTDFFIRAITYGAPWRLKQIGPRPATFVADRILRACARHQREVVLTAEGRAMVFLNKFAPRLVDSLTLKIAVR